ncbi:MAG: patatin-like phospholipase family protein [Nocardioides sp.]
MTRTALVLGGGGITGIAWELGILQGLAEQGLDLSAADRVIGTSAGSVVGAQITSDVPIAELYDGQLAPPDHEIGARLGRTALARLLPPMLIPGSPVRKRRRIGRLSQRAHAPGGHQRIEVIRSRIASHAWPERELLVTTVDTDSGEFVTFDRHSGVDLVDAVAASCAVPQVWPAVTIDGRHFMDGGMRSTANVDVARGADVVVVLAPLPQSFSKAASIGAQLRRIGPVQAAVITPDRQALVDIGSNVLDPEKRADAARTGLRQSRDVLDKVRAVWPT